MDRESLISQRRERIETSPSITLFHATNRAAVDPVLSQGFKPGYRGYLGGGIYFAENEETARRRSRHGADCVHVCTAIFDSSTHNLLHRDGLS